MRYVFGFILVGSMVWTLPAWAAGGVPADATSRAVGDLAPEALVQCLGDRSFAVRRAATARLVELGVASLEALRQGVQSPDREVSFRSTHVLKIVRESDFQRRLRAFAAAIEPAEDYHLPGWARFAKEVGASPEARSLFVEMQQAEPALLAAVEDDPNKVPDLLVQRVMELQEMMQVAQQPKGLSLGTIATVLFILNGQDVELPLVLTQSVGSYFRYPSFAGAIQAGSQRDILRKMLSQWIEGARGWDAYHGLFLAMQYDLPAGLVPARRILEGDVEAQSQSYFLCYALLTLAKFGNASHMALVEPTLENKMLYGGTVAVGGDAKYRTQVRDVALATLVELAGLAHKDFGFTRLRRNPTQVFNTSSLAFEDDAKRDVAIQKWRETRRDSSSTD
jgi:hypothetical protein